MYFLGKKAECMTEVVAALIWKGDQFMICQRPAHKARGLLWEFVGGKVEPGETREEALVRECREELCLGPKQVELLGAGDRIATPGGVLVHSFAGVLRGYEGGFSQSEVAQVFTVPLAWLKSHPPLVQDVPVATVPGADFPFDKIPGGAAYPWRGGTYRVLFYEYEGRVIWGITAKVLHRMLPLL